MADCTYKTLLNDLQAKESSLKHEQKEALNLSEKNPFDKSDYSVIYLDFTVVIDITGQPMDGLLWD